MSRRAVLIILALFLAGYVFFRIAVPPSVVKEIKDAPPVSAASAAQPLPPEKLSQFQGMSVYTPPPPRKEIWVNPPDGPPPRKDKNEKYVM